MVLSHPIGMLLHVLTESALYWLDYSPSDVFLPLKRDVVWTHFMRIQRFPARFI